MKKDQMQVSSQATGQIPAWKTDLAYDSDTPINNVPPDGSTVITKEDCSGDQIVNERKMTNDQQLAHRTKPADVAKPWAMDGTADDLPHFQAGEIEYGGNE